jgi:prepilin-type N-terminal cleavage/methylation domain-containing protein
MLQNRRAGLTLMEVLVTLVILAIGVLAILTLFPLAAVNMARAVKDDRSYHAARSMDGLVRGYWKAEIVETGGANDPLLFNAFDDPDGPTGNRNLLPAGPFEWSYPVVVDPWGYTARVPGRRDWIGDPSTFVPRRTMSRLFTDPQGRDVLSAISLKDTVGYDADLRLTADREYRYNALVIAQRPLNINRYAANLTVVVFDNRPFLFAPSVSEAVFGTQFTPGSNVRFIPGGTTITVNHTVGVGPNVRPGRWVMDASVNPGNNNPARPLIRHANLYQVVSVVTDTGDPTTARVTILEVQTPVTTTDNNLTAYNGTLVVLDGVSGVFQRPALTAGE